MKLILFSLIGFCLISCNEDYIMKIPEVNSRILKNRTDFDYIQTGLVHNDAIQAAENTNTDWTLLTDPEKIDSVLMIIGPVVTNAIPGTLSQGNIDFTEGIMELAFDDSNLNDIYNDLRDFVDNARLYGDFSTLELNLVDRMIDLFEDDYSNLSNQQAASVLLDSLSLYVNIIEGSFTGYTRDELLAAFYLAESSAEYWDTWFQAPPGGEEEDDGPANAIIIFDAVGYLLGWGRAYANDQGPGYSNSKEAQGERIMEGAYVAAAASTFRGLALRFK